MNDEMPLGRGIRCLDTAATTRPTSTGVWSATPTTTLPSRCSSELTSHPPIRVTPRSRSHPSKEDRRTRPNDSAAAVARHWSVSLHGHDGAGSPPRRRSRAGGEHTAIPMHEVDRRTGQPAPDRALSPRSRGLPRHFVGRVPIVVRQQQARSRPRTWPARLSLLTCGRKYGSPSSADTTSSSASPPQSVGIVTRQHGDGRVSGGTC